MKKENKNQNYKIGFYIRVSTDEQAENPEGSIKNQEERLRGTVKLKNMESSFGEVVDVFVDRAKSGKDTNRPELQRLLQSIREQKVDLVMVSELSRISRNIRDFSDIWELMKICGCGFYSLRENFETTTAAGEMVLYTLANLAQFERRQVSERVSANMNARAARGLYNGGSVPVGYRLNPDKPGTLEIDPERSLIVKKVFEVFLEQETLLKTAKFLNEQGFRLPRKIEGGGQKQRLDFFTVDNVHHILRNKTYIAVRDYQQNGETKEAIAVWEALVEKSVFEKAQQILTANRSARKPFTKKRYPYLLSGLVKCERCGNALVGKSAHGRKEKIGYYEHGWATKKNAHLTKKIFHCEPHRILAKKLEPLVLDEVKKVLFCEQFARELIAEANQLFLANTPQLEIDRIRTSARGYGAQIEALVERLSEIPKGVSARPIYLQMEKIEKLKNDAEARFEKMKQSELTVERPAELRDYQQFLNRLREWFEKGENPEMTAKVIRSLVKKIEVGVDSLKIYFCVGSNSLTNGAPGRN